MRIAIDWAPGTLSGWQVYGLNLALQWCNDPEVELSFPDASCLLDPLRGSMLNYQLGWEPNEAEVFLHALGNEFLPEPSTPRERTIGVIFFEEPLSDAAVERARRYPLVVAGSSWNRDLLAERGLENIRLIFQGVDRSLFHPATRMGVFKDRFAVFSGGKAEWRKGQDIVLAAFREFSRRHDEAILVTAWQSPWDPALFTRGKEFPARDFWTPTRGIDVKSWAQWQGIDPAKVHDCGLVHNTMMPLILRECDCAVFPSRAEGGTNLPAMECLACGIPTAVSNNTGNLDLPALHIECESESVHNMMEIMYRNYHRSKLTGFHWSQSAHKLKELCREVIGEKNAYAA